MRSELATVIKAALIMTPMAERSSGFVVSRTRGVVRLWPDGERVIPDDTVAGHFLVKLKLATTDDALSINTEGYRRVMQILSLGPASNILAVPSNLWTKLRVIAGSYMMRGTENWTRRTRLFQDDRIGTTSLSGSPRPLMYRALISMFSGEQILDIAFNMDLRMRPMWDNHEGMHLYIIRNLMNDKFSMLNDRLFTTAGFLAENITDEVIRLMSRTEIIAGDMSLGIETYNVGLENNKYKGEEHVINQDREYGIESDNTLVSLLREAEEHDCPARELWRQASQVDGAQ